SQEFSVVGNNVAIVENDRFGAAAGQNISKSEPATSPLPLLSNNQIMLPEFFDESLHSRTIMPDDPQVLWQYREELGRVTELLFGHPVHTEDNLVDVRNLPQLFDNTVDSRPL